MIAALAACLLACAASLDQQRGAVAPQRPTPAVERGQSAETPSVGLGSLRLQGFSVVLVVGDMQGTGGGETVPAAARKALANMEAFLPFKRFQLLDTAWMACCGMYGSPVVGRIRGLEEREYSYSVETVAADSTKLTVRFTLRDGNAASASSGSVMDSTFSITVGETVVIGTSRLKGDQALIALLTAVGKPGGAR